VKPPKPDCSLALNLWALNLWALNRLPSESLVQIAADWLANGLDSPSLRELAGIHLPVMSEVGPLFQQALTELHLAVPPVETARLFLAHHYAQQIIDGTVSPYAGAQKIWWEVCIELDRPSPLLLSFVGAASELDELPERALQDGFDRSKYARELEEIIVASAREILRADLEH